MPYVTTLYARVSRSARGELFNPLIYPFLLVTFAYGVGFTLANLFGINPASSLYTAMFSVSPLLTLFWGILAVSVIVVGLYVLVFDKPPIGKANCFVAWMLWLFVFMVYILTGGWLPLVTVAIPSLYFWTWQYLTLARFRWQDIDDNATMEDYHAGHYDDDNGGKQLRLDNRGVDPSDRTPDDK